MSALLVKWPRSVSGGESRPTCAPFPYPYSEPLGVHAVDELEEELLGESDLVHLGDALDPLQDVALLLLHVRSERNQ